MCCQGSIAGCWHTSVGPLEGTLLLGQAVGVVGGDGTAGRSKDNPGGCQGNLGPVPSPRPGAGSAVLVGELLVDLAGDVALEGSDDLGLGAPGRETSLHVGD